VNKIFIALVLILSCWVNTLVADEPSTDANSEWVIVLDDPRPARLQGWQRGSYRGGTHYEGAIELKRYGNKVAKKFDLVLKDQWLIESLSVYCLVVSFNGDVKETKASLERTKGVQWVQPSNEFELLKSDSSQIKGDEKLLELPDYINGQGVTVAVVDSAVDLLHQDIKSAISEAGDFVVTRGEEAPKAERGEMHGTAIAGVIVSQRGSKFGIAGVAPAAKVVAYRGCWEGSTTDTHCNTLSLARALDAVTRSGVDILNLSLSGPKDGLLDRLIQKIVNNEIMVVAAFDPKRTAVEGRFPTQVEGVLVVRADTLDQQHLDVFSAPGERVVASPGGGYDHMIGHSIATAYTSGVLALCRQAFNSGLMAACSKDWRSLPEVANSYQLLKQVKQSFSNSSLYNNAVTNKVDS